MTGVGLNDSSGEERGDARDWKRARDVLVFGYQHRVLLRPPHAGEESVYPRFAERARGCQLLDAEGRSFIDWVNGWGPVLLGYRHPKVEEAILHQLEAGPTLSLTHRVELDVATTLTEMIPCAEMVGFGKNGSDALTAAVRVARAHTGREVILHHGFHGFHDWYVCRDTNLPGMPHATANLIREFPYNDLAALEALFEQSPEAVAAVVMEPTNTRLPEPGFLEGVRDLAHRHGALLIFDEVVTGFRLANGGAQELFGVVPDLACFGKGIANGMPLSAVVGRRRYMRLLASVGYGMTFHSETLSLAAARAVLKILREEPVVEHLARVGRKVREEFHRECEVQGVHCSLIGPDARMTFDFAEQGGVASDSLLTLFLRECARHGVLTNGTLLSSYAHDDVAVHQTLEALSASLAAVARAVHGVGSKASDDGRQVELSPMFKGNGHIEAIPEERGFLRVHGWLLVDDECPDAVEIVSPAGETQRAELVHRPDVANVFPLAHGADRSGFTALLSEEVFAQDGDWELEVRALCKGEPVFRCLVLHRAGWSRAILQPQVGLDVRDFATPAAPRRQEQDP